MTHEQAPESPEPKTPREVMEEAARELETEALIRRMNAGSDPMTPVSDADEGDGTPVYEPNPENAVPPAQVIEEEGLGVKE